MLPTRPIRRAACLLTAPARLGLRALGAVLRRGGSESETAPPAPSPRPATTLRSAVVADPPAVVPSPEMPMLGSELPIPAYDALNARDAIAAAKALTDAEDVRAVLRFEEENAKRTTVHRAVRTHLEWLESGAAVLPS